MNRTLFWLIGLSLALSACVVRHPYGPGLGYGYPGDPCNQHPDMCSQVVTVPVVRTVKMTGVGRKVAVNGRSAGSGHASDPALEKRVGALEGDVASLNEKEAVHGGNDRLQNVTLCRGIIADPEKFTTPDDRDEMVSSCKQLLAREDKKGE